jgi:hypothetical protein
MKTTRLRPTDRAQFENRFSEKDRIQYQEIKISDVDFEDIKPYLSRLPEKEIDLLTLYRKFAKNQKDIARIMGVTQGAVSSRLKRALVRLKFLRDLPKISDDDIDRGLSPFFHRIELEIIKCMRDTTCQSETAKILNDRYGLYDIKDRMTQVKVRHRFEKCLHRLESLRQERSELGKYYDLLLLIKNNLYKLHEVKLPHFDRGRYAVFSLKD